MRSTRLRVRGAWVVLVGLAAVLPAGAAEAPADLARKAEAILRANCYRCHGQDGAIEGGLNYVLDRAKLVARHKVVPGKPLESPLFVRVAKGKMPPADEQPRPTADEVALLQKWIEAGAPSAAVSAQQPSVSEADVFAAILADLEKLERRQRRFIRYFSLAHLYNSGLGDDELQTYRHALAKLINSLSWHPRITRPQPIDPAGLVLRIDLRNYFWDANLWNRLLAEYPYGILQETTAARACAVNTGTRLPVLRADWFIANASRPPLYHDLLQLPASLAELERQLRVDAAVNLQQERVARAGFNGSGVARNNRLIERHDAVHGAYWRTYDFEAVAQNLSERDLLLPDRRNLFAHPLGPGNVDNPFLHAGGEVIWNLPNGLQAYLLVNAANVRVDRAPTAIVSDPKRPDRAVENGISCMGCHYRGINFKDDQIRDFVRKHPHAFSRKDTELVLALYPPARTMQALMEEDMQRFQQAVEKTGGRISAFEPILAMTLRYEADVDLATAAAELGVEPASLAARLGGTETLARNLGPLSAGGTVQRQVFVQAFADLVRAFRLGVPFQPGLVAQSLPDNTGEIDPLEGISRQANSVVFAPDGRHALFASADKTVRLWDVEGGRDIRRFIGHTASVWAVAFAPDARLALSGSADRSVRLWDVASGRELARLEGHDAVVTCVAFSPDGRLALSGGYDHALLVWDLSNRRLLRRLEHPVRYVNGLAISPDGQSALVGGDTLHLVDLETGKAIRRLEGHQRPIVAVAFSPDSRHALTGSDDGTARLWEVASGRQRRLLAGHVGPVRCVAFSADGRRALSGGADGSVRLWDLETASEIGQFDPHAEPVIQAVFIGTGQVLSASRDSTIHVRDLGQATAPPPATGQP
jgi:WD40 repeat protein/mono/diheme cytochrome c family protein